MLGCDTAAGMMLLPLILYEGKVQLLSWFKNTEDHSWIAVSQSGVMDSPTFAAYMKKSLFH